MNRRGFFRRMLTGAALAVAANYAPSLIAKPVRWRTHFSWDEGLGTMTLGEWAKTRDGKVERVAELLNGRNELLDELVFYGNGTATESLSKRWPTRS